MIFMTFLKIVFTVLLCIPILYLMIFLLTRLIDEVLEQNPKTKKKENPKNRRAG